VGDEKNTEWMTAEEAAEYTRLAVGTIYNKVSKGTIPHHGGGRLLRFRRDELDRWLAGEWPDIAA